ncbi:hypothetical protein ACLVWQ_16980 [Streptomyces sp. CWNU-52B]|uniref:hypothetical protein n=1 Tax=unclassified Streptomyces TaxID=2593676 RepID=UPI0039C46443
MRISANSSVPRGVTSAVLATMLLSGGALACGKNTGSDSAGSAKEEPASLTPAAAVAKAAKNAAGVTSLSYRITGTVPGKGRLRAEASMRTAPSALSMEMTAADRPGSGRTEIRFVDGTMYVGGSAVVSGKLDGKSWFSAAPAVWGQLSVDNNSYGVLPRQFEGNPAVQSTLLTCSKEPRKIGTETVDGTRTTHYRGTVIGEGCRAARDVAADKATRERRIGSYDQFVALGLDKTLTMDLWIDGDGRAKRFRMRGDSYDGRTGGIGDPLDLTVTILEVNQRVTVRTPPAEDTADLAALADATLTT